MSWPTTWLNNLASNYVSRTPGEGSPVFDHPFLHVVATPAEHLLAMKVVAARGVRDGEDIRLLLDRLRITAAASVWEIVARYFPGHTITDRSRLLVEDLLDQQRSTASAVQHRVGIPATRRIRFRRIRSSNAELWATRAVVGPSPSNCTAVDEA